MHVEFCASNCLSRKWSLPLPTAYYEERGTFRVANGKSPRCAFGCVMA